MSSKKYEKIDGIKIDKSMPEDQKKKLRDRENTDTLDLEEMHRTSKQRVTIMLDTAIVNEAKKRAKTGGIKYQSLLNDILKNALVKNRNATANNAKQFEILVEKMDEIHAAIEHLKEKSA